MLGCGCVFVILELMLTKPEIRLNFYSFVVFPICSVLPFTTPACVSYLWQHAKRSVRLSLFFDVLATAHMMAISTFFMGKRKYLVNNYAKVDNEGPQ